MAGAKTEGAAAPKRGAKGGQQRETPPPAEVNVGGAAQPVVQEEKPTRADPLAQLASVIAGARGEKAAIEAIDRAELDQLVDVLPRLGPQDGRGRVEDEIARRRRAAAAEAGVRSQEERDEGVIWRGQASLPCPLDPSERRELSLVVAVRRQELDEAEAAMAARHKAEKEAMADKKRELAEPQKEAATGLRNALVEAEARVVGGEVINYRLDTGIEYNRRPATDEERAKAAQRSLFGGGR